MLENLEYLRKKPESVRRKYALFGSIFITVVILFIWVSTFSIDIKRAPSLIQKNHDPEERYGSLASVYFNIKKGVSETISFIKKSF